MPDDERLEDAESEEPTEEEETSELEETDEDAEPTDEEEADADAEPSAKPRSVEDQVKEFSEKLEATTAKFDAEIKRLQNENAYYRNRYEEATRGREPEEVVEEKPPVTDEEWFKDPVTASRKIARWELEQEKKKAEKASQTNAQQALRRAYAYGRDAALKTYPKLFRGKEREIEEYVFENIRQGRLRDPADIANPETWAIAAESLRRSQGELDFSKYYSSTPPMATEAPYSEVPAGSQRKASARPRLDREAQIFIEEVNRGEKKKITEDDLFGPATTRKPNPFAKKAGTK